MNFFEKKRKLEEARKLDKKIKRKKWNQENKEWINSLAKAKYRQKHGLPIE